MKEPPEQTRTDQKSQNTVSKGDPQALVAINLRADQQGFDQQLQRYVAKGNVSVDLAGGRVLADRLEYETASRTLLLSGRVRFQRGEQYFQANSLRYSLIENSGDADAVYGVIDFDTSEVDFDL
ncbi:MAG: LptA/OstA family protein, partial [Vulcanococcus sp.]